MATIPTLISVEEYLHTSYHPDCDYVDGEVEERTVGEYSHNKLLQWLMLWFGNRMAEWQIDPLQEQRINISSSRYRVCDLTLLKLGLEREEVTVTPPLLCIEVMSPQDRIIRATRALDDLCRNGRPAVLVDRPLAARGLRV